MPRIVSRFHYVRFVLMAVALLLTLSACAGSARMGADVGDRATGKASYYAGKFVGRPTANGEIYDPRAMTAAHRTLPFGTRVRVTRRATGESVIVRINDRGPFVRGRIIDLSKAAAEDLDMIGPGVVDVELEVVDATATADSAAVKKEPAKSDRRVSW